MNFTETAVSVAKRLIDAGYETYFAGGYVRDHIMGLASHDIDIATSAKPHEVENLFRRTVGIGRQFGIMVVCEKEFSFEVAAFRADGEYSDGRRPDSIRFCSAEEDAKRRDITINALFMHPLTGEIIDYVDGQKDIRNKIIRMVGNAPDRISEDYLRIIRVVRFAARFDFEIEKSTEDAVKSLHSGLSRISKERFADELSKICSHSHADKAFDMLFAYNLLHYIFPEKITDAMAQNAISIIHLLEKNGGISLYTVLAAFYKDFWNDSFGRKTVMKDIKDMKFSNAASSAVSAILEITGKIHELEAETCAAARKLIAHEYFSGARSFYESVYDSIPDVLIEYEKRFSGIPLPQPLINGYDLITLGIQPGPVTGKILQAVYDAQLDEKLTDKEAALELARTFCS